MMISFAADPGALSVGHLGTIVLLASVQLGGVEGGGGTFCCLVPSFHCRSGLPNRPSSTCSLSPGNPTGTGPVGKPWLPSVHPGVKWCAYCSVLKVIELVCTGLYYRLSPPMAILILSSAVKKRYIFFLI